MNWVSIGTGKGLSPVRHQDITWTNADLLSIVPLGANFSEILIRIQSFSFKNMCLKISQRKFPSGDLLIYLISRLIWYVCYAMQAKCWLPYSGHKTNNQCNRVWHNTLPPYAASHWLCYLFIAIPTSQGMPTNMIEISHLLLISSTECAQYILCRRILPSAVCALVSSRDASIYARRWKCQDPWHEARYRPNSDELCWCDGRVD